jgi:hypothetical protein
VFKSRKELEQDIRSVRDRGSNILKPKIGLKGDRYFGFVTRYLVRGAFHLQISLKQVPVP